RQRPESEWRLSHGALLIYYLFPNVQMIFNTGRLSLVRIYPVQGKPSRSLTRIVTYCEAELAHLVLGSDIDAAQATRTVTDIYDPNKPAGAVATLEATMEAFYSTVEKEDYAMGELQQRAAESGMLPEVMFGRNEAPLHHFHNSFREVLGMDSLEPVANRRAGSQAAQAS
ncbi:MAG: SRPBCC family protein, partial [Pseudomonadales bacterium]